MKNKRVLKKPQSKKRIYLFFELLAASDKGSENCCNGTWNCCGGSRC